MINVDSFLLTGLACVFLSACATSKEIPASKFEETTADALFQMISASPPNVLITNRASQPMLFPNSRVAVNGHIITKFKKDDFIRFYLPPGDHEIWLNDGMNKSPSYKISVKIVEGRKYAFDITGGLQGFGGVVLPVTIRGVRYEPAENRLEACCTQVDLSLNP